MGMVRTMKLVFQSKRLHFRPLVEGNIDIELALWTDPEVVRFITGEVSTVEEIRELMPVVTKRAGSGCIGIWCLTEKTTNEKLATPHSSRSRSTLRIQSLNCSRGINGQIEILRLASS